MPIKWHSSNAAFGLRARCFHYVGLLCVIALVAAGYGNGLLPHAWRSLVMAAHKLTGFGMAFFTAAWLVSYAVSVSPSPPPGLDVFKRMAARIVKLALLGSVLIMACSGWGMASAAGRLHVSAFGVTLPALFTPDPSMAGLLWKVHETTGLILLGLLAVHAGAALYHHIIRRDGVLVRMFPFVSAWRK